MLAPIDEVAIMKRLWAVLVFVALLGAGLVLPWVYHAGAQQAGDGKDKDKAGPAGKPLSPALREEEKTLRKAADLFAFAFAKGDIDTLTALWSEHAEYIHESGKVYRGRKAIRGLLEKALGNLKGSKHTIKIESIRFIRPEVALQEGTTTVTSPDGAESVGRFSSILVKQDGRWLLERVRDLTETEDDEKPVAYNRLKQLAWMVGEWQDKDGKGTVKMSCRWGPSQTFLMQEFAVTQDDGKVMLLSQRIGWDAHEQQIRSWVFDSTGSFGSANWTRDGNAWDVESEGVYADGKTGSSADRWKFVNANTAVWSSKSREADDLPLPDIETTLVRKTKDR
jgi:uncharacterized protein (TIGR02246 family)